MKGDGVTKNDKNIGEKEFCDSSEHLSRHEHMTSHPATKYHNVPSFNDLSKLIYNPFVPPVIKI